MLTPFADAVAEHTVISARTTRFGTLGQQWHGEAPRHDWFISAAFVDILLGGDGDQLGRSCAGCHIFGSHPGAVHGSGLTGLLKKTTLFYSCGFS